MKPHHNQLDRFQSEGDLNISPRRAQWLAEAVDSEAQRWLDTDAHYFLHQSLSTPCLNVLKGCDGINIEDLQGRRYMDFHGNNVHQVGFSNPKVIEAACAIFSENVNKLLTSGFVNIPFPNGVLVSESNNMVMVSPVEKTSSRSSGSFAITDIIIGASRGSGGI